MKKNIFIENLDGTTTLLIISKKFGAVTSVISTIDAPRVKACQWHLVKERSKFYVKSHLNVAPGKYRLFPLAALILSFPKDRVVDHINGDSLNNTRENLREASYSLNAFNRKYKEKAGGWPRGITKRKDSYLAWAGSQGGRMGYLGSFKTIEQAISAREDALTTLLE